MEESKEADVSTGEATHKITRGINDKVWSKKATDVAFKVILFDVNGTVDITCIDTKNMQEIWN
jgi:hypothetical protein